MESDTSSKQRRVIQASEILAKIERGEPVACLNRTIEGDLTFRELALPRDDEGRIIISEQITITNSEIRGIVEFNNAIFQKLVSFMGTNFKRYAYFSKAKFCGDAFFSGADFYGDAGFFSTSFCSKAAFNGVKFHGDARFKLAKFYDNVSFSQAEFYKDARFQQARFSMNGCFWHAQFGGNAYFIEAQFNDTLDLSGLKFNIIHINWRSLENNLVYDGPVYLALIKNFKVIEQFGDADDCEYQYRKKSQDRKTLYDHEKGWDWSKFLDIISWISCGYGIRPLHTVFSMSGVVFITSIIFLGYFNSMFESFYFSLMTFTGGLMMFTGGEPGIMTPDRWLRTLAMIEAILGYLLMALFVVVLARKFIR